MSQGSRRTLEGIVKSDKMDKTAVIEVTHRVQHPVYQKFMSRRVCYKAHDEANESRIGDRVRIEETRPISKDKRWVITEILERAPIV